MSVSRMSSGLKTLLLPLVWVANFLLTILNTILFCLLAPFQSLFNPLEARSRHARSYKEWKSYQIKIDDRRSIRAWCRRDQDASYDSVGLRQFKEDLEHARRRDDVASLCGHLRAQATRNCSSLLSPQLFVQSRIQTKRLIHEYIHEARRCIGRLARKENATKPNQTLLEQEKHQSIGNVRQALGRTTLVLQGGANLSLCHFGVVRALYRRGLLPRIITATGTGAIAAAMVGCTPDEELLTAMTGAAIDISAFVRGKELSRETETKYPFLSSSLRAIIRRTKRYFYIGHFFDIDVLAQCIRDNVGDVTFEEAYANSGRVLNITIAKADVEGTPQLLNHITAPHVVVWSAVAASVATSKQMFAAAPLMCKNDVGVMDRYFAVDSTKAQARRSGIPAQIPMERIGELFDVNHYIISQTRPYIVPFVQLRDFLCQDPILGAIVQVIYCEVLHRLGTFNRLGLLPKPIQRIMIDELIPSTSSWSKFVIVPDISFSEYFRILDFPTAKVIDFWAMKGERSVWPKVCQLQVRCSIEFEVEAAYRKEALRPCLTQSRSASANGTRM